MLKYVGVFVVILTNQVFSKSIPYNCDSHDGMKGFCKPSKYCEVENYKNRTYGIEPVICGEVYSSSSIKYNNRLIYCCTDIYMYFMKEVNNHNYTGMKVNEKKCLEYSEQLNKLKNINNEIRWSDSIICESGICHYRYFVAGGLAAEIDEFPHMALLGWERLDGNGYDWNCGGSLISGEYILTAAHCIYINSHLLKTTHPTSIRLGGSTPMQINISSIVSHPNYKPPKKYNDIALIKLEKPIVFTVEIFPACLYGESFLFGNATTIGWGDTSQGGDKAEQLQKVTLDLYEDQECKSGYPQARSLPDGIVDSQFCAGYKPGGKDACQGDSGGPIQRRNKENIDIFDVIGITSFGAGCGSGRGGVYTRVSHYIEWIEKIVWPKENMS